MKTLCFQVTEQSWNWSTLSSPLSQDTWLLPAAETKSTGSGGVVTHSECSWAPTLHFMEPTLTSDVSIFLLVGNPAAFACEAASVNARSVNQTGVQTYQLTFRPSSASLSAPPCSPLSLTTHHWSCQPNMFILTPKVNSIYPPNACPWTGGGSRNTRREPTKVRGDQTWRTLGDSCWEARDSLHFMVGIPGPLRALRCYAK